MNDTNINIKENEDGLKLNGRKGSSDYLIIIAPLVFLLISVFVVLITMKSGVWPAGSDTYYYLYRSDLIYKAVGNGNFYPLLDEYWYNGLSLQKCVAQLVPYIMAACQWLGSGNEFYGYLIFVGLLVYLCEISWFIVGRLEKRPWIGFFLGIYWFFVPHNLFSLYGEGALARSFILSFFPLLIYSVYSYLKKPHFLKLLAFIFLYFLAGMSHVGFAGMIGIVLVIVLIIYGISTRKYTDCFEVIIAILLSFALMGIWLFPYLSGESSGVDSSETMINFFQNIFVTLNPVQRLKDPYQYSYYGLSFFIIAILGMLFSGKDNKASFITGFIIVVLSSNSMFVVLKGFPGGQYLWMTRFFSLAIALCMLGLIFWKRLNRKILFVFILAMILDFIPSTSVFIGNLSGVSPQTELDTMSEYTLLKEAEDITVQRMALMDLGTLSAKGAYHISDYNDKKVMATFGAGWESSTTAYNIAQVNKALSQGYYLYMFDRLLELGNDTVLVKLSEAELFNYTKEDIINAGAVIGYDIYSENSDYLLFHFKYIPTDDEIYLKNDGGAKAESIFDDDFEVKRYDKQADDCKIRFGIISKYKAIAIGEGASQMALQFPGLEEAPDKKLDQYTFDELKEYELIYLNGFIYDDKAEAEQLILKLSEAGVHVVIAADGIPEDRRSHDRSFLGVTCNDIVFSNGYPVLDTIQGIMYTDLFPQGYTNWQTVYVEGLSDVWGSVIDNNIKLPFIGTGKNDNLVYIAINLTYYYGLTRDSQVGELLAYAMDYDSMNLPARTVVPIDVNISSHSITVNTAFDDVDTTLAYHDFYKSDKAISNRNHLLYVDNGKTVIEYSYIRFIIGAVISGIALIIIGFYMFLINREHKG